MKITIDRAVVEQALEALNSIDVGYRSPSGNPLELSFDEGKCEAAIAALRAALAQQDAPVEEHKHWCASLTQLLLSDPPKRAPCDCKKKQAEPVKPVAALTAQRDALLELVVEMDQHEGAEGWSEDLRVKINATLMAMEETK